MSENAVQTASGSRSTAGAGVARPLTGWRRRTTARFYVCVGFLLLAAATMQGIAASLEAYFRKLPVPLKKKLHEIDRHAMAPEYRPHPMQPPPLEHDLVENLGTEDYLQWYLVDTARRESDSTAVARLFVTYYTGQPDMVPHNPKECIAAAGAKLSGETLVTLEIPRDDGRIEPIPVSVLEFDLPRTSRSLRDGKLVVAYFFYANGEYVTERFQVRRATQDLWDRHSFYAKIEVAFVDYHGVNLAGREETIAAAERLLRKLMPVLWRDHIEDWDALEQNADHT